VGEQGTAGGPQCETRRGAGAYLLLQHDVRGYLLPSLSPAGAITTSGAGAFVQAGGCVGTSHLPALLKSDHPLAHSISYEHLRITQHITRAPEAIHSSINYTTHRREAILYISHLSTRSREHLKQHGSQPQRPLSRYSRPQPTLPAAWTEVLCPRSPEVYVLVPSRIFWSHIADYHR